MYIKQEIFDDLIKDQNIPNTNTSFIYFTDGLSKYLIKNLFRNGPRDDIVEILSNAINSSIPHIQQIIASCINQPKVK